jgi:hypothetical protein
MNRRFASLSVVVCLFLSLSLPSLTIAQTPPQTSSALPRLVRFGGVVKDLNGLSGRSGWRHVCSLP